MQFDLPDSASDSIRKTIVKDMDPTPFILHMKLFFAVAVGGIVSLAVCGQFGMGMTSWAEVLSHKLHENMPPVACSLICGTVYAIFPTILLRVFLCSPMQFRVILRSKFLSVFSWYASAGISLAYYGQHGQGAVEILSWFAAAVGMSYLLALLFKLVIPKWDLVCFLRN